MREAYRWLGHPNSAASVASIYDALAAAAGENDLPVNFFELAVELLRSDGSKPRGRARRGAVHASDRERARLPTPLIQSKQSPTPQSSCATCGANSETSGSRQPPKGANVANFIV